MRFAKIIAILAALITIASCFFPWVMVEKKGLVIGGMRSDLNEFGKPGIIHLFLCSLYIIFLFIGKVWSVRSAFFLGALNLAWAIRNFVLIAACSGGECPVKLPALYVLTGSSIAVLVIVLMVRVNHRP